MIQTCTENKSKVFVGVFGSPFLLLGSAHTFIQSVFFLCWFHQTDKESSDRSNTCSTLSVCLATSLQLTQHTEDGTSVRLYTLLHLKALRHYTHNLKAPGLRLRMLSRSVVLKQLTSQGKNIEHQQLGYNVLNRKIKKKILNWFSLTFNALWINFSLLCITSLSKF